MSERILLRMPQVEAATGLKKSSIYKMIEEGTFPRPVRLGVRAVAWRKELVQRWINELPQA